jgi:voltage-gated potassium channel Kch
MAQMLSIVVALSMFLTPTLFIVFDKVILPRFRQKGTDREADEVDEKGTVIIAGIGRFGQIVNRLLIANGVPTVVLDYQVSQIDRMRAINVKSFYGDATRPDLLHTAGIEEASLLVIAIDDTVRSVEMVRHAKHTYGHVQVLVRAYDRGHFFELKEAGADYVVSEIYNSALTLAGEALKRTGMHAFRVEQLKQEFTAAEQQHFDKLFHSWRNEDDDIGFGDHFLKLFMQIEEELIKIMQRDRLDNHVDAERRWTPPPKERTKDF